MVWIYAFPAWLFMLLCIVVACALTAGGLWLAREKVLNYKQIDHNDVSSPILATIGTVLAVVASFMVAGVWQEFDQAAQVVQNEASAISNLHHLADAFDASTRKAIQARIDRYVETVVNVEWPLMRRGQYSRQAQNQAYDIQTQIINMPARNEKMRVVKDHALFQIAAVLDARRNRILDNRQGIPMALWATLLLLGAITVGFTCYFRVARAQSHTMMAMALATVIAIMLALIAELDYPFRGDVAIEPTALTDVLQMIHDGHPLHSQ